MRVEDAQPYIVDWDTANFRELAVPDVFFPHAASAGGAVAARIASCSGGYVIAEPDSNPGLVSDCEELMDIRASLASEATLNWNSDTPIERWHGVGVGTRPLRVTERWHGDWVGGSPPRVTVLWLTEDDSSVISGSVPQQLFSLTDLEQLTLNGYELIGTIPVELSNLTNLRRLDIYRTKLTGSIPAELGNLLNLEYLNLSDNELTGGIPAELGNLPNLEYLNLSDNELTGGIPAELGNLPNLNVSGNRLEGCMTLANGTEVCS